MTKLLKSTNETEEVLKPDRVITTVVNATNLVDYIMEFEGGDLDDDATIALFQYLIDTGQAWTLQGFYGRTATTLIEQGYCHPKAVKVG